LGLRGLERRRPFWQSLTSSMVPIRVRNPTVLKRPWFLSREHGLGTQCFRWSWDWSRSWADPRLREEYITYAVRSHSFSLFWILC